MALFGILGPPGLTSCLNRQQCKYILWRRSTPRQRNCQHDHSTRRNDVSSVLRAQRSSSSRGVSRSSEIGPNFGVSHGFCATPLLTVTGGQSTIKPFQRPLGTTSPLNPRPPVDHGLISIATLLVGTYYSFSRNSMHLRFSLQRANLSIEQMSSGLLRKPPATAHVERWASCG